MVRTGHAIAIPNIRWSSADGVFENSGLAPYLIFRCDLWLNDGLWLIPEKAESNSVMLFHSWDSFDTTKLVLTPADGAYNLVARQAAAFNANCCVTVMPPGSRIIPEGRFEDCKGITLSADGAHLTF